MLDTAERVRRVHLRTKKIRKKRESYYINGLIFLSVFFLSSLIGSIAIITAGGQPGMVSGLTGSMILHEGAGGYIFVSVLSFTLAVIITIFCVEHVNKKEKYKEVIKEEKLESK